MQEAAGEDQPAPPELLKAQKHLGEQGAENKEEEERAHCKIAQLKAKFCTSEAFHEQNDLKALNFKQELENTKDANQLHEAQAEDCRDSASETRERPN